MNTGFHPFLKHLMSHKVYWQWVVICRYLGYCWRTNVAFFLGFLTKTLFFGGLQARAWWLHLAKCMWLAVCLSLCVRRPL